MHRKASHEDAINFRASGCLMDLRDEIASRVDKQVLLFLAILADRSQSVKQAPDCAPFSGSLDPASAREIIQAIEEECERVDAGDC